MLIRGPPRSLSNHFRSEGTNNRFSSHSPSLLFPSASILFLLSCSADSRTSSSTPPTSLGPARLYCHFFSAPASLIRISVNPSSFFRMGPAPVFPPGVATLKREHYGSLFFGHSNPLLRPAESQDYRPPLSVSFHDGFFVSLGVSEWRRKGDPCPSQTEFEV